MAEMLIKNREVCIDLAKAESEDEVIEILEREGYWVDPSAWIDFGYNENNFSTIGNQQSSPDAALVEKIINSVDALLMRGCMEKGINPLNTEKAPTSIYAALEDFFCIYSGRLTNLQVSERNELAENIKLIATGSRSKPCYTIIDEGEGQTPNKMPDTFLSLNKSNKLRIPFVQGKFNMGGTGVLQFCGVHNVQLIISKRNPLILKEDDRFVDDSSTYWGFTVVRRFDPSGEVRSSVYKYLAPSRKILRFEADELPLAPTSSDAYGMPVTGGAFIKLYDYQMSASLRTNILFDLYNRLSLLMPEIALPVRMYERRDYTGHTLETTLTGLNIRIEEDKRSNVEEGFPTSAVIHFESLELPVKLVAFKEGQDKKYTTKEGILFAINGQTHGYAEKTFFKKKSVGMAYIADSILVIVDCSKIPGRAREDLFMNSRDRLRKGEVYKKLMGELEELISNHAGLRELKDKRRRELLDRKSEDDEPIVEAIEKVMKKSPTLNKLFIQGKKITNPVNPTGGKDKTKFEGKEFPTYFMLEKEYPKENPRNVEEMRRCRIKYKTDARNDYFSRESHSGEISLFLNREEYTDFQMNLWNGYGTLNVSLPKTASKGMSYTLSLEVSDPTQTEPFSSEFTLEVIQKTEHGKGEKGKRKPPSERDKKDSDKSPEGLALPNIIEVRKDEWGIYNHDEETALEVRDAGVDGYDFFINMDNIYLQTEKVAKKNSVDTIERQYKYGLVLLGLGLLNGIENKNENEDYTVEDIQAISSYIAPFLIPTIDSLHESVNDASH